MIYIYIDDNDPVCRWGSSETKKGCQNANATNMGSKNYQNAMKNEEMPNVVVLPWGVSPNDYHLQAVTMGQGVFQQKSVGDTPQKAKQTYS